jgi:anti-sigma-K factor RskA
VSDCPTHGELLGGYVLGALEPEEMRDMRRHLESCSACSRELARLGDMPGLLDTVVPADVPPPAPPPRLEEALLDRVARETRSSERPRGRARRRRRVLAGGLAAVVATVALVLVLTLSDSDEETYAHASLAGAPGARAEAEVEAVEAGTRVRLRARGLAPAGYELWCIRTDGHWVSGGSFHARDGSADVELTAAVKPGQYHRLVVSRAGTRAPAVLRGRLEY